MLPSTGYFSTFACPFFDSGLCNRPYCHFRHRQKEGNIIKLCKRFKKNDS